jgi:hypothetical protein
LAWLLDFHPRPSIEYYKNPEGIKISGHPPNDGDNIRGKKKQVSVIKVKLEGGWWSKKNWKSWTATICCLILMIAAFAYYKIKTNQKCMYWTGDHYEASTCEIKINTEVIALNKGRLDSLKMVTRPDTITYASIGKLWWGKTNGVVHFYTAGGDHPTDSNKRLLPITKYMIDKYVTP